MKEGLKEKKMPTEKNAHIVRNKTDSKSREDETAIAMPGLDMLKIH